MEPNRRPKQGVEPAPMALLHVAGGHLRQKLNQQVREDANCRVWARMNAIDSFLS